MWTREAGLTDEGGSDAAGSRGSFGSLLSSNTSSRYAPGLRNDDLGKPAEDMTRRMSSA